MGPSGCQVLTDATAAMLWVPSAVPLAEAPKVVTLK
jgi:hypothetical protein